MVPNLSLILILEKSPDIQAGSPLMRRNAVGHISTVLLAQLTDLSIQAIGRDSSSKSKSMSIPRSML